MIPSNNATTFEFECDGDTPCIKVRCFAIFDSDVMDATAKKIKDQATIRAKMLNVITEYKSTLLVKD